MGDEPKGKPVPPLKTWTIGEGKGRVTVGLYTYAAREGLELERIVARGFAFCPTAERDNTMQGLYDPQQSTRIGFSEAGTGVAVASGSGMPNNLTEAQRNTARDFIGKLEEHLTGRLAPDSGKEIEMRRKHPQDLNDPTEWDERMSTALYVQYPVASNTETIPRLSTQLLNEADWLSKQYLPKSPKAGPAKTWVIPPEPTTAESVDSMLPESVEEAQKTGGLDPKVIAALYQSLSRHFPGDGNATARLGVLTDVKKAMGGQNLDGPTPPAK